jgi:hypothetical protein
MTILKDDISSQHLSNEELLRYHRRQLSKDEILRIEKHLQECELCSDALNGILEMNDISSLYPITHELKMKMRKRFTKKKKLFYPFDILNILVAFFIIGLVLFLAIYFLLLK